jgi:hypothetical protein
MLKAWSAERIERALVAVYAAEAACKQAGSADDAIVRNLIGRLARR